MTGLKMTIDEAKADAWIEEVETQVQLAEEILQDISRDCYSDPADGDTILEGIQNVAKTAETVWSNVNSAFNTVTKNLKDTLSAIKNAVEKATEKIEDAASAFNK